MALIVNAALVEAARMRTTKADPNAHGVQSKASGPLIYDSNIVQ